MQFITDDKTLFDLTNKTIKHGTLDTETIELYDIEGFGDTTVSRLITAGIKNQEQLFKLPLTRIKRYGIRISQERWDKLREKYGGYKPPKPYNWTDW